MRFLHTLSDWLGIGLILLAILSIVAVIGAAPYLLLMAAAKWLFF